MLSIWEKNSFVSFDFIIVGGGILGLSTAVSLKMKFPDKEVLVLERGAIPSGASTKNAGFACFGSLTEILSDIRRTGADKTAALVEKRWEGISMLRQRLGDDNIAFINYGGFELIDDKHGGATEHIGDVNNLLKDIFREDAFREDKGRIAEFGFNADAVSSLIYSPFESQIDTGKMMRNLIALASCKGVMIVTNYEAIIDATSEDKITVSSHNSGIAFTCRNLISCSNAFTSFIIPEITIKPGRGQVIATTPVDGLPFRGVFHIDEGFYYFRNYGDRVILGGGRNLDFEGEETFIFGNSESILKTLDKLMSQVILPGRKYEIEMTWSGIMGFNDSKMPEVIKVSDNLIAGFCCNGMGVALASSVAQQLADCFES